VVTFDDIDSRLKSGRYEPVDCEAHRSLNIDALPVDAEESVYIRFGDVPESGRSVSAIDGRTEAGVSVYEATIESVPADVDEPGMFCPFGPKLLQVILLAQRETYLVTGTEVGRGTDGEPLLEDVDVVAPLTKRSGMSGWVIEDEDDTDRGEGEDGSTGDEEADQEDRITEYQQHNNFRGRTDTYRRTADGTVVGPAMHRAIERVAQRGPYSAKLPLAESVGPRGSRDYGYRIVNRCVGYNGFPELDPDHEAATPQGLGAVVLTDRGEEYLAACEAA